MTHVTCRLTAKNRDQLRNPTLGNRVWATFTFAFLPHAATDAGCSYSCLDVAWSVCPLVGHDREFGKTAEPIEMTFGGQTGADPSNHPLDRSARR